MTARKSDIAIVGMACRFPSAANLQQYWDNILGKEDAVGDPPPDWRADLFYDPEANGNDRTYCKRGGWLGDLAWFDPVAFGTMPNAVDGGEPDHFLALQAACGALDDAGYDPEILGRYKQRTEVIIGRGTYVNRGNTTAVQHVVGIESLLAALKRLHPEYSDAELAAIKRELKSSLPAFNADTSAGLVPNIISGRVANRLDLMGPNYIVDAACASSLVAVDLAVRDLQSGRCDMAVAGGVHASTPPVILVIFSHLKALSRQGRIRPFDERADGTLLGEGVGMVVLKRLEDAERDCDRVYALIKGIGTSSDGKALGLMAPRLDGEKLAMERAYEEADVAPATVALVEAHGTGTPMGDRTELEALDAVFGDRIGNLPNCALGSVKSMISHTMPASGVAGLIKAALALHHKVLPPTIHCEQPHPRLQRKETRFYINSDTRPWIQGRSSMPRRAGVNAFGFGGVNAHAVLEEYQGKHRAPWLQHAWDSELVIVSGDSQQEVAQEASALLASLGETPEQPLRKIAWTQSCGRELRPYRLAIVATSIADLGAKLEQSLKKLAQPGLERIKARNGVYYAANRLAERGQLAALFPGEGAQYPNMLADLCVHFPEVREVFDLMDRAFENHPRGRMPSQVIFPPPSADVDKNRIWSMDAGAEAVFCANQAMLTLLRELRVPIAAYLGHSTGEHTALLAAGVVRPDDERQLIEHVLGVNRVFEDLQTKIPEGVLVAVAGCSPEKIAAIVQANAGKLFVALDNCPNQAVLCGTEEGVERLTAALADEPAVCQRLPMARAYHTPWFSVFSDALTAYFRGVSVHPPATPLYSCVTADRFPQQESQIRELCSVGWSRTVRFREAVEKMHGDGVRIFVEAGPRGNLTSFVDDALRGREYLAIPSNIQTRSGILQLHHLLAQLVAHGVSPRLEYLYSRRAADAPLPERPKMARRVATGLQPMSLPEDFALPGDQRGDAAERPAVHGSPEALPAMENGTGEPWRPAPGADPPPFAPEGTPEPAFAVAAVAADPVPSGKSSRSAAQAMERHLATMERFVASQQRVMSAYLDRRRTAERAGRPAVGPKPSSAGAPFIAEILEHAPGRRARAAVRLSLEKHPLFLDHTLGREISADDPSLPGLSVVPLAVTMEILAQGAALVEPAARFLGMRDLRASRWITFDAPAIALEIEAVALQPGEVEVRLRSADGGKLQPILAEAVLLFGSPEPAAPRDARLREERPSSWQTKDLYRLGMFHGPSFRAVSSMDVSGADGCRATMTVLPRERLLADDPNPRFLTDPIVVDAAGQAVAFWSQEILQPRADIFPYSLKKLEVFHPPSAPGTRLDCRVFVRRIEERTLSSDIEIVDQQGQLHYRFTAWDDRRFSQPSGFWQLRIAPRETFLSTPFEEWLGDRREAGVACVRFEEFSSEFYETSHGIWQKTLAHLILSRRERQAWSEMSAAEPRKRDWLAGRCAAKDAVRRLIREQFGETLAYADIEIMTDRLGRPTVEGRRLKRLSARPVVSLAHAGNQAVALAASRPETLVGVDLEPIERSAGEFATLAFSEKERALAGDSDGKREWLLRLWTAKEAVSKAVGRGLSKGLDSVRVEAADRRSGEVRCRLSAALAAELPDLRQAEFVTMTRRIDGFVYSATLEEAKRS